MRICKWFIRILCILIIGCIIWFGIQVVTPAVDVFSYTGFHGEINAKTGAIQSVTYTINKEELTKQILSVKPKADKQIVVAFVNSIKINIEFLDAPGEWRNAEHTLDPRFRGYIVDYDKALKRKIGIKFYRDFTQFS